MRRDSPAVMLERPKLKVRGAGIPGSGLGLGASNRSMGALSNASIDSYSRAFSRQVSPQMSPQMSPQFRRHATWASTAGTARECRVSPSMYMALPLEVPEAMWDSVEPALAPLSWTEVGDRVLHDARFQGMMALLILFNAAVIGAETDLEDLPYWDIIENLFLFVFGAELVLKMCVLGCAEYFSFDSPDFNWNLFDFLIVSLGVFDLSFGIITGGGGTGGVATVFRIIRLMRILRIFRIVKFLKQLYVLAFGFALAAVAVFWVTFLMIFVLYVCSIILVRTSGHVPDDYPHSRLLHNKFGTIPKSMFTLFELMSSPNLKEYRGIMFDHPVMMVFLVGFIIFGSFGMIALLTGVISETMFEKNALRQEEERSEREATRKMLIQTCGELFNDLPTNERGEAPRDSIPSVLPRIAQLFENLGVEFSQDDLFSMVECLDVHRTGGVSREEWRRCIVQMAEGVRPLQIMELYHQVGLIEAKTDRFEANLQSLLEQTRELAEEKDPISKALKMLATQVEALGGGLDRLDNRVNDLGQQLDRIAIEEEDEGELRPSLPASKGGTSSTRTGRTGSLNSAEAASTPQGEDPPKSQPFSLGSPGKGLLDSLRRGAGR